MLPRLVLLLAWLGLAQVAWAQDYDVVVIGAGMGGLSAGVHLANGGLRVLVLEQHHKVGGCTSSFTRGEYRFETALHEMTGGGGDGTLAELLRDSGVADKVELIEVPELYRSIMPGVDFTMPADPEAAEAALIARWPEEEQGIRRFHRVMRRIYEDSEELEDLYRHPVRHYLVAPFRQPTLLRFMRTDLQSLLDRFFEDPALKAVAGQFWIYYGPPPSRLWTVIFMAANHAYMSEGAWHVRGSSQALVDAYVERITELGGQVRTGTRVTQIHTDSGRVTGVSTEHGDTFAARYVVSNADPFQTFFTLVGEEHTPPKLARRIRSMKPANSLFGVYLGLDVEPSLWDIDDHEIFYSSSLDQDLLYDRMMAGRFDEGAVSLTFYANLGDPWYAPPGKSVVVLHAYSDISTWPAEREAYEARKAEAAAQLIGLAEDVLPGLSEHIVVQEVVTPRTIEAFTLQKDGIPYGWEFNPRQGLRLANDTPIDGLYLAGSWTNPGHGVATAQISGYHAARLILDEEGRP